jgi:hypothetical protein
LCVCVFVFGGGMGIIFEDANKNLKAEGFL